MSASKQTMPTDPLQQLKEAPSMSGMLIPANPILPKIIHLEKAQPAQCPLKDI